jgi:hypothetical protein
MTGTTFAMSWCVSLRRCAVAGHDFSKTLTQTIKTREIVPVIVGHDEPCAPNRFIGVTCSMLEGHNLVHGLPARTALVLFSALKVCQIHGKSAKRCGQSGP